jgi:hypothetical protein
MSDIFWETEIGLFTYHVTADRIAYRFHQCATDHGQFGIYLDTPIAYLFLSELASGSAVEGNARRRKRRFLAVPRSIQGRPGDQELSFGVNIRQYQAIGPEVDKRLCMSPCREVYHKKCSKLRYSHGQGKAAYRSTRRRRLVYQRRACIVSL